MNLYPSKKKGYYIYMLSDRNETRYKARRRYDCGYIKNATFNTISEAVAWLTSLVGD